MNEAPIYLDFNATTPLEPEVVDSIQSALTDAWGNPSSTHPAGKQAKQVIQEGRNAVSKMIHCDPGDIVFTSGGTETNNWVLQTAVQYYNKKNQANKQNIDDEQPRAKRCKLSPTMPTENMLPHFVTTNIEHDSIRLVLEHFEKYNIAEVTYVRACHASARINVEDVIAAIKPNTCMITIMLANNETGVIQPIAEICDQVKLLNLKRSSQTVQNILLHTDAAQAIGKIEVNVNELGVDYLTIVGHKFYAPRIGAIYTRGLHNDTAELHPIFFGGGQERNWRPGTENTGMVAGLGKAAELVSMNLTQYSSHMKQIRDYLEEKLQHEFQVHINGKCGDSNRLPNTCNVSFVGEHCKGYQILARCKRLQAGVGAACHSAKPSQILLNSGVPLNRVVNSIRLSTGRQTTKEDIDAVIEDLKEAFIQIENGRC